MISALLGALIMSSATIAMLVAINITNESIQNAGKYPLTAEEKELLIQQGFSDDIEKINRKLEEIEIIN